MILLELPQAKSAKKPMQQPRAQEVSCLCDDQLLERKDSWTHVFRLVSGVWVLPTIPPLAVFVNVNFGILYVHFLGLLE